MRTTKNKPRWSGPAKALAAGLMCLSSFVAPLASDAHAADNLTISGAQGGGSGFIGTGAKFEFGTSSYQGGTGASGDYTTTWQGWQLTLGGGGSNWGAGRDTNIATAGTVTANTVSISSGTTGPAAGGAMDFSAGAVSAPLLDLTKKNGALNVTIGRLDVVSPNSVLGLDSTTARSGASGVAVNSLSFAGNAGLTVTPHAINGGTMTFGGDLTVYGKGNSLDSAIAYNATGKTLRFYLPATVTANDTMLTVTGSALDITGTTIGVGVLGKGLPLVVGDTVTLIKASSGLTADANYTNTTTGMQGISKVYVFGLSADTEKLLAKVNEIRASDDAVRKSPSEGRAAAVGLITQGADLAAGAGMVNARVAARGAGTAGGPGGNLGIAGFGAVSGGTSRYNSGSHVDVNSFSFMTGLAKVWQAPVVDILGGVFFETGFGSYNSYNGLEGGGSVKGKGDSRYMGGGLLGRVDLTAGALAGLYAEASFRAGGLHLDYKSGALPYSNERASYDTSAAYYGAHAGLGYVWLLTDKASLDLYAKYFWNHTADSRVTILDDAVRFKTVDSHRTRLGARFSYAVNEYITPYVGAAWDYEFDGKARSVVAGEGAPAPSLKGSTGVGELGLTWKPAAASAFSIDAGVQGYTGKREGVSGNVQLKFEF